VLWVCGSPTSDSADTAGSGSVVLHTGLWEIICFFRGVGGLPRTQLGLLRAISRLSQFHARLMVRFVKVGDWSDTGHKTKKREQTNGQGGCGRRGTGTLST